MCGVNIDRHSLIIIRSSRNHTPLRSIEHVREVCKHEQPVKYGLETSQKRAGCLWTTSISVSPRPIRRRLSVVLASCRLKSSQPN